jgi:cytochrome c heme-lyase
LRWACRAESEYSSDDLRRSKKKITQPGSRLEISLSMGWFWSDSPARPASSPSPSPPPPSSAKCPVDHSSMTSSCPRHSSPFSLNPRNNMPSLPNEPLRPSERESLPTARETSSIPMNERGERWEYPSPQQMLNAMQRKGYDGTNPEDVPAMVAVHNWLNEGSWEEVLKWERKYFSFTPPCPRR